MLQWKLHNRRLLDMTHEGDASGLVSHASFDLEKQAVYRF